MKKYICGIMAMVIMGLGAEAGAQSVDNESGWQKYFDTATPFTTNGDTLADTSYAAALQWNTPVDGLVLKATGFYPNADALIEITPHDQRNGAGKVYRLLVSTLRLQKPIIKMVSSRLRALPGVKNSDRDGLVENGETIQIDTLLKNEGKQGTLKLKVAFKQVSQGLKIVKAEDKLSAVGGGQTGKASLAIQIPPSYLKPQIEYTIGIADIRGSVAEKTFKRKISVKKASVKKVAAKKPRPAKIKRRDGIDKYAVVVGLDSFRKRRYAKIPYAASDAKKFSGFLSSPTGGAVPGSQVKLLTGQSATLSNITGTIKNLLSKTSSTDTVQIYMTTHGIIDNGGIFYMLCHDSDLGNLSRTALSESRLAQLITRHAKAKRIVFYLNLCHAGDNAWAQKQIGSGINKQQVNRKSLGLAGDLRRASNKDVAVFCASSVLNYSMVSNQLGGSNFAHFLIKGLKGAADQNYNKWISTNELESYLVNETLSNTMGGQRLKADFNPNKKINLIKVQ